MFSWHDQKVAITGATGFVGSHTALELRRHGADVTALVRKSSDVHRLVAAGVRCAVVTLSDVNALAKEMAGCQIAIHAAGAVGFDNDWGSYYQVNVEGTRTLVQAARFAGVRRIVHVSSIVAVGAASTAQTLDESTDWNLRHFRVPYVTTKRWGEEAALDERRSGLEVVVVNPASVVGPGDFGSSEFGTLCRRFWRGKIRIHFGGGNNFVDVRDVACGIRLAAERGRSGERYLLAGENRTYDSFFTELCRTARTSIARLRLPNALAPVLAYLSDRRSRRRPGQPLLPTGQAALMGLYFFFEANKARNELGYHSRPLRESLADAHAFWVPSGQRARSA